MNVPLLDLQAQYKTYQSQAEAAVLEVMRSQRGILSEQTKRLETELSGLIGTSYALGVSSGTDALLLALMGLGIGSGDEVIMPTFSFFATAGTVARLAAKPVFADIDPQTFNIDINKIEELITDKTKAIMPVHLFGQSANMDAIMQLAEKYNLFVIEDCAQSIGARYKDTRQTGSIGTVGCFSFYPTKNLGAIGDAGLITTNNKELYERMKIMRVHGGEPKYYHHVLGGNFRIDEIQSAILNVKLPFLEQWSNARRQNAEQYIRLFHGLNISDGSINYSEKNKLILPQFAYSKEFGNNETHIMNQFIIRVENRDELKKYLDEKKIGNEIYYPVCFHEQKCFSYLNYKHGDFPVAERVAAEVLALPIYPELSYQQINYVVNSIAEFFE